MLETSQISTDSVSITSILTACSQAGLIDEAVIFFNMMTDKLGFRPSEIHYCCMVDVFGRAGLLEEAEYYMSFVQNNLTTLTFFLAACGKCNNVDGAEFAFKSIMDIDMNYAPAYELMSNIYTSQGLAVKRKYIQFLQEERKITKSPRVSYITVNGMVHSFVCEEKNHEMINEIYQELDSIYNEMKLEGFNQDESCETLLEEKSSHLFKHSELIAIVFGILNAPQETPLSVVQNIKVCEDCHTTIKLISKLKDREIIVYDSSQVHHFRNGNCSCGD